MANSCHEIQMPLDLLMELLVRLPGKSLMRFKSVSQHWFALITHPVFIDMHHTRSHVREGGVFHIQFPAETEYRRKPRCWDRRFLLIDWTKNDPMTRATVHDPSSVPYTANTVSNIVNGLICFYHHHFSNECISVYNFTTRENLPLPPPTPPLDSDPEFLNLIYYLGFDPVNKVYKVLHFWTSKYPPYETQNEAFITVVLNDNRWRPIKACPYVTHIRHCTSVCCIDGFLYWQNGTERVVVEFDVNREKFSHIIYPLQEVTHDYDYDDYWARRPRKLTQIRGQLSLVVMPPYDKCHVIVIKIWRLVDRTDNYRPVWTKEVVACPFFLNYAKCPFGLSSFGLVTLVHHLPVLGQVLIDCYVLATRKYTQLKINNAQALLRPPYEFCPSKLVENIMPLKNIERQVMLDL